MENKLKIIGKEWLNLNPDESAEAFDPERISGKMILLDFWSYTCFDCLKNLRFLRLWWDRYKGRNFSIIGIHAPEFEFEKESGNIEKAIVAHGIRWPVLLDNDLLNRQNYEIETEPSDLLFGPEGEFLYGHEGAGDYEDMEVAIQAAIARVSGGNDLPEIRVEITEICLPATPRVYCGFGKGLISNPEGFRFNQVSVYDLFGELEENTIALEGKFLVKREYVEARQIGAAVLVRFRASRADLVVLAPEGTSILRVFFNNIPLPKEMYGEDLDDEGELHVSEPRLYNIIKMENLVEGTLKIVEKRKRFRAYGFSFSGCLEKKT